MIETLYQCVGFCAFMLGVLYLSYLIVRKPGDKFFM